MRVGIDTVEISRIQKSLEIPGFKEKVFTAKEIEMLSKRNNSAQSYAANFAAKEAFSKALGTGFAGISLREISVLRDGRGAPYLEVEGRTAEAVKGMNITVSLTHTRLEASAIVIIY